jgi:glutaredoxin 1
MYQIYATPGCGFCIQAKRLLESKELPYEYNLLSETNGGTQAMLMEVAGRPFRTVPQIFKLNEEDKLTYVGGFEQLKASFN